MTKSDLEKLRDRKTNVDIVLNHLYEKSVSMDSMNMMSELLQDHQIIARMVIEHNVDGTVEAGDASSVPAGHNDSGHFVSQSVSRLT